MFLSSSPVHILVEQVGDSSISILDFMPYIVSGIASLVAIIAIVSNYKTAKSQMEHQQILQREKRKEDFFDMLLDHLYNQMQRLQIYDLQLKYYAENGFLEGVDSQSSFNMLPEGQENPTSKTALRMLIEKHTDLNSKRDEMNISPSLIIKYGSQDIQKMFSDFSKQMEKISVEFRRKIKEKDFTPIEESNPYYLPLVESIKTELGYSDNKRKNK